MFSGGRKRVHYDVLVHGTKEERWEGRLKSHCEKYHNLI